MSPIKGWAESESAKMTPTRNTERHPRIGFTKTWKWPMSKAQEYRDYAAECLRLAERESKDRDYWLAMAARWKALAVRAAKEPTVD